MPFYKSMSFWTNTLALLAIALGYAGAPYIGVKASYVIYTMGIFAFSGSITNWLAIYMLFEKVPFLYGSGVIPDRFEDFKAGIKQMLMQQFFRKDIIEKFLQKTVSPEEILAQKIDTLKDGIDLDKIYQGLVEAILSSSFGKMLGMFGGEAALTPLKEPIKQKLAEIITQSIDDLKQYSLKNNNNSGQLLTGMLEESIAHIVDQRLAELTPKMVKDIIHDMIAQHLGWLVVWGGVFGAVIGLVSALL